jgi:recombination protein RecT
MNHADQYSAAFSAAIYAKIQKGEIPEQDMWKYSSYWYKSFDDMAKKTLLRQLLSKWGQLSVEMQRAYESDSSIIDLGNDNNFTPTPEADLDSVQTPSEPTQGDTEPEESATPGVGQDVEQLDINEL